MFRTQKLRLPLLLALAALLAYCAHAAPAQPGVAPRSLLAFKRHGGSEHDEAKAEEAAADCYASGVDNWNMGLHVGAIFIILATAGLGVYLPVLARFVPFLRLPRIAITLGKHLGTGVIIATGLIHMLPASSESLNDPCVGDRMGGYSGWPGVLAMMAIFAMHLLEFVLTHHAMGKHGHSHGLPGITSTADNMGTAAAAMRTGADSNQTASLHSHADGHEDSADSHLDKPLYIGKLGASSTPSPQVQENCDAVAVHTHHTHVHGASFLSSNEAEEMAAHRYKASTYILELGICAHSVIIGLTLSVATGTSFTTLLIAIVFHQFCEGLALGSRLAEVRHRNRAFMRAAISAGIFALVTPLGMVIGIGIHNSYAPASPASLITIGVLDGLSAGILLYTGLVNLLAEEFGTLEFRSYSTIKKTACFVATFIGAGVMALIGKWA